MAVHVRQGRASFRRSIAGQAANELSSEINATWLTDIRNKAWSKKAETAANRVTRLSDRAKAFERAIKPLTQRSEVLTNELGTRAQNMSKASNAYNESVKSYKRQSALYRAGDAHAPTFEELNAMYRRQGRLYHNAKHRELQYNASKAAYNGLRNSMLAAYDRQRQAAKQAQQAYKQYQKRYGKGMPD